MNAENRRQEHPLIGYTISTSLVTILVVALLASNAIAEGPLGTLGGVSPFFGDGVVVGGGYPFKASTPAESFARGAADVIRAQGEFNRLTSEAAINWQEAKARAIVNARDYVDAYFRNRQANRDYRRAERGPRPTAEDLERYAQAMKPTPLSPSELDVLTGRVNWPILLRADCFSPIRAEMENCLTVGPSPTIWDNLTASGPSNICRSPRRQPDGRGTPTGSPQFGSARLYGRQAISA